jgi:hypothetical protein
MPQILGTTRTRRVVKPHALEAGRLLLRAVVTWNMLKRNKTVQKQLSTPSPSVLSGVKSNMREYMGKRYYSLMIFPRKSGTIIVSIIMSKIPHPDSQ